MDSRRAACALVGLPEDAGLLSGGAALCDPLGIGAAGSEITTGPLDDEQADKKSSVTVKQDNGAVVTYGNLNEVKVKQDDRILKEAVLGTADSYVTINALKDNEKIKVSDAFS